jgi:hypothetical protein
MLELGPVAGERSAQAIVDRLRLADAAADGRPGVAAVMIASADGRAAVGGSSAPLGHPADSALSVRSVLCEGGPTLLRALVATRCIDHFLLTLAPTLGAGSPPAVLEGVALDPPAPLRLHDVHRAAERLFTHYVPAP